MKSNMKKVTIPLKDAFYKTVVSEHQNPVIHHYELAKYMFRLYQAKQFNGTPIGKISSPIPTMQVIDGNIDKLVANGLLEKIDNLPIYKISSHRSISSAQAMCVLNPFCYLSHLSAMEFHGLTDRIPHVLHVTTAPPQQFRVLATDRLTQDFGDVTHELNVLYRRWKVSHDLIGRQVLEHTSQHFKSYPEKLGTGGVRVSPVGRTFLDMLKHPQWCGGIYHVLDVFEEYAPDYLATIVKVVDKEGSNIDKARLGYLLEERFKVVVDHPIIDKWKAEMQRGGSRLLVAGSPYLPIYSETWSISINLPNAN